MRLPNDIDIHTHVGPVRADAVLCVDPTERFTLPEGEGLLSVGIHPWNVSNVDEAVWKRFTAWTDDSRVIAIGEAGVDRLRGPAMELQTGVFEQQAQKAANLGLPLIVHCVRAYDVLLGIRRRIPEGQWIVHGFRGKPELARQLLDAGIDLSYGNHFNVDSFNLTPPDRRYLETDDTIR